ncbi:MAG TPA: hypothetical protein VMT72_12635, partial [Pseudolabrys sp.]|nr:hypothetical protein [Pseudolabrys sp.]
MIPVFIGKVVTLVTASKPEELLNTAWPWLRNFELLAIDPGQYPTVKKWVDKIAARDAVKRALAQVGTLTSIRDKASDDQRDRFFSRGKYARA